MESFNLEGEVDLNDLCNLEYFTVLNLCPTDDCDERTGRQKRPDGLCIEAGRKDVLKNGPKKFISKNY